MRHYLDFAATSALRPPEVVRAVSDFLTDCGASAGRGGHSAAIEAERIAFRCRRALMKVLRLPGDPGRIAFTFNATHALNTALWGILDQGDAVVLTQYEHNSVLRPVHQIARERGVELRMLSGSPEGGIDWEQARAHLAGARLLVVNAVSNVLGVVLPVTELAALAREAGALVLVDAAQAAGHVPIDLATTGADLIAFTGHKGLLGPQGTGGLWVREGVDVRPLLRGGTGGDSMNREMPSAMPDHLEAGTGNTPGLAGLLAGCEYLLARGVDDVHRHESALKAALRAGLGRIPGVRLHSPAAPDGAGVVTITHARVDPATLAELLDREFGVLCRPGLHCAPEVHRMLGTEATGALRLSVGWCTSEEDVAAAVEGVTAIVARPAVRAS
ncbi:MAG: aminotransferase class V-fold PLP-dependent enzyme [Gemmatimonadetes bacterium]|nr:aminotransferase class V-fold PLP-dependent enzyme [Gemmatimonadota bacterium]